MTDIYRNLKLMQNVRLSLAEVDALKNRMNTINLLLQGNSISGRYFGLNIPVKLLGVDTPDESDDMEDFFISLTSKLESLLRNLEEDMFTAQELRNLGREVDV